MKGLKITVLLMMAAAVLCVGIAFAAQQEVSVEKGKALFNDVNLGTNGKTCNTCHRDGKGLENAATKGDFEQTIVACITMSLRGKALDAKSAEVQSLALYIKSIAEKKPAATKKAPVGC